MRPIPSDKGGRAGFVYRDQWDVYRALRRKGYSKSKSARIANNQHALVKRKAAGRKAARTRKARGKR